MTDIVHILPDKCPKCGEVVRNDMSVYVNPKTKVRERGHVQFACNFEIEIQTLVNPVLIRDCRKGQIWPRR
jgi:hypothetical protein